jgi:transcription termination factor Rho
MKKYDLESVGRLRIHELRDFAKSLRIPSPTTMKKEELIEKIKESITISEGVSPNMITEMSDTGEMNLFYILSISDINEFKKEFEKRLDSKSTNVENIDSIKSEKNSDDKKYDEDTPYELYNDNIFTFKVAQGEALYFVDDKEIQGYVDIHNMGYGIIRNNMGYLPTDDDVYVPKCFMDEYEIVVGEIIRGKYKYSPMDKKRILTEIISIDGSSENSKKLKFEELVGGHSSKKMVCTKNNLEMMLGDRAYIDKMDINQVIALAKDIKANNEVNVKVFNNKSVDDEIKNSSKDIELINIPIDMQETDIVNVIEFIVERIKREVEVGTSNVLIIYKFGDLIRQYSAAICGYYDYSKVSAYALNKIIKILSVAKSMINDISSTIICIDKNGVSSDLKLIFENEIEPLFKTKIFSK